jgi:hypothetical protein
MYTTDKAHRNAMSKKRPGSKMASKARMTAGTNRKGAKPSYPPR